MPASISSNTSVAPAERGEVLNSAAAIASFGTTHFYVWKEDVAAHTRARIRRLEDDDARVSEIARMLGGEQVTASAVAHAKELLESARSVRKGQHAAVADRRSTSRR